MAAFSCTLYGRSDSFGSLRELLAKATPKRSGDALAGVAAESAEVRVAAQICLAEVPLRYFLEEPVIPYESDEVTRLIFDSDDAAAFAPVAGLSVGEFRNWLLEYETCATALSALTPGLTPEMVAAVTKLMGNQDLILVAKKCSVITRFRSTIGLPGTLAVRLQPNHPTDASGAVDRRSFLVRPDLGRTLDASSQAALARKRASGERVICASSSRTACLRSPRSAKSHRCLRRSRHCSRPAVYRCTRCWSHPTRASKSPMKLGER